MLRKGLVEFMPDVKVLIADLNKTLRIRRTIFRNATCARNYRRIISNFVCVTGAVFQLANSEAVPTRECSGGENRGGVVGYWDGIGELGRVEEYLNV